MKKHIGLLAAMLGAACTGTIVGPTQVEPRSASCGEAPRLLRRTGAEYRAAVAAVAPVWAASPSNVAPFTQPRRTDLFSTWSSQASLDEYDVSDAWAAADGVATEWVAAQKDLCPASARGQACLRTVYGPLLERLWSRPPSDFELARLGDELTDAERDLPLVLAVTSSVRSALMAPAFLFRSELGIDGRLQSAEVAAALSYSLWSQPPDEQLRALVGSDALKTPEAIARQAQRLLERPTEVPALRQFLREFLQYDRATDVAKDHEAYSFHHPGMLIDDTEHIVEALVKEHARSGLLRALLTSHRVYARPETAAAWGVTLPADAGTELTDERRTGVLTHPSWLVAMSQPDHNHLVRRGRFIRERLLCGAVPNLPGGVVPEVKNVPGLTLRQRLAQHASDSNCSGCHRLMDPLGAAFESWDHLGRLQVMDNGGVVTSDGVLEGADDADGPYANVAELMSRLADSPTVKACWVKQLFRSIRGREVTERDVCELERLTALYDSSGEDTVAVISAMFASTTFLHREGP